MVKPRRTHPDGTGYQVDLYRVGGVPEERAQDLETQFLKRADQLASDALQILLHSRPLEFTNESKSAWSRFVLSMVHRNPEKVASLKEEAKRAFEEADDETRTTYLKLRKPEDPPTYEEFVSRLGQSAYEKTSALVLRRIIDSGQVGTYLNSMRWSVFKVENPRYPLLTSDRPVVKTDGIIYEDSHIVVPIGPLKLFLAAKTEKCERQIQSMPPHSLVERVNHVVASQAEKYVYGTDDRQLRFIENRLERKTHLAP